MILGKYHCCGCGNLNFSPHQLQDKMLLLTYGLCFLAATQWVAAAAAAAVDVPTVTLKNVTFVLLLLRAKTKIQQQQRASSVLPTLPFCTNLCAPCG